MSLMITVLKIRLNTLLKTNKNEIDICLNWLSRIITFMRSCDSLSSQYSACSVPVVVRFIPKWEKEVNFNVVCNVKRKMLPLTLNVKAEGYSMNCLLLCDDATGNKVELSSTSLNHINFGRVSCCYITDLNTSMS